MPRQFGLNCIVYKHFSGHLTAACIQIQEKLDRPLLWLACRRHIGEILLDHVWKALSIEPSKSPEHQLFKRLRLNWDKLPHSDNSAFKTLSPDELSPVEKSRAIEYIEFGLQLLQAKNENGVMICRDDYRELLELSLYYLKGLDPRVEAHFHSYKLKKCGAVHKARWMGKTNYLYKLVMLKDQILALGKGAIMSDAQAAKVQRFVIFLSLCYMKWWFCAPIASKAPWMDLCLIKNIEALDDDIIRTAGLKAFKRHYWYICSELVGLSLFDESLATEEKSKMAQNLVQIKSLQIPVNRIGKGFGKPYFPEVVPDTLAELVGPDSLFLFHALSLDVSFLSIPVEQWPENQQYLYNKAVIKGLKVSNDAAERGVKLASDFLDTARREERYQEILQVVEMDRKLHSNLRKKRPKEDWFLYMD